MSKIKCPNCKYEWECKSKLGSVTCPNCQRKFQRENNQGGIKEREKEYLQMFQNIKNEIEKIIKLKVLEEKTKGNKKQ